MGAKSHVSQPLDTSDLPIQKLSDTNHSDGEVRKLREDDLPKVSTLSGSKALMDD